MDRLQPFEAHETSPIMWGTVPQITSFSRGKENKYFQFVLCEP